MKLLQWNVWYKEEISNILRVLKEINADVICLQELTINHPHHNLGINTPRYIAEGLDFNYFFKEGQKIILDGKKGEYGNGIFSRYPIIKSDFYYIQDQQNPETKNYDYSKEGRVYVEILAKIGGRKFTIGTTHMSFTDRFMSSPTKEVETNKLIKKIGGKKDNFIIAGDFNSLPGSYTIDTMLKFFKNAGPSLEKNTWTTKPFSYEGFEANTLDWRLDYCFVTPDLNIKSVEIIDTKYSDHLPILIEFL